ncbi:UDP-N-acetylmuramoyl-L-alanine--D-glutamate ligase, partial [Candidatus Pelagibacter sp.]|nr:UDP-N-acetylmuramoyl-L-alanine--D-glutamate ligase [Candidatus Pelagibacter sp.]
GLFKKGDKFTLNKKYFNRLEAFIYGKDQKQFLKIFNNKFKTYLANDLKSTLKLISKVKKKEKSKITILFSPAAASFDQFKNFEHRGDQFNKLTKKYLLT